MKILIDGRLYGYENTGIGRYVVNLINELKAIDRKNEYVLLLRKKYSSIKLPSNWIIYEYDIRHYSFREQFELPRVLNKFKPDIVHFPHFNIPVFYKGKFVVTIHDLSMHKRTGQSATTLPYMIYLIKRLGYKYVFKKAVVDSEKVIVPTKYVKKELSNYYRLSEDKIVVTYEGLDELVKSEKKWKSGAKPFFLYAGNIYPHKNLKRAIEAVKYLNEEQGVSVSFVIVSPRSVFQKKLKSYIKELDADQYVNTIGFVSNEELASLYSNSVGFIYPSLEEGFGLPGLEAMANNTFVLASDIPVFREVFGGHAIYFNPYDFSSIQQALFDTINMKPNRRKELTSQAAEFVKQYSWQKTATETLKVYQSVV